MSYKNVMIIKNILFKFYNNIFHNSEFGGSLYVTGQAIMTNVSNCLMSNCTTRCKIYSYIRAYILRFDIEKANPNSIVNIFYGYFD